jgi:PD-(D/E)XK nuclease superfamily
MGPFSCLPHVFSDVGATGRLLSFFSAIGGVTSVLPRKVLTGKIIEGAMRVHSALGRGLLASAYEVPLVSGLRKACLQVSTQMPLPVVYDAFAPRPPRPPW